MEVVQRVAGRRAAYFVRIPHGKNWNSWWHSSKSDDENARKQVSGLEAVIAAMIASGMDENSPEVATLKGSLVKAKRNAQEAPIAV